MPKHSNVLQLEPGTLKGVVHNNTTTHETAHLNPLLQQIARGIGADNLFLLQWFQRRSLMMSDQEVGPRLRVGPPLLTPLAIDFRRSAAESQWCFG